MELVTVSVMWRHRKENRGSRNLLLELSFPIGVFAKIVYIKHLQLENIWPKLPTWTHWSLTFFSFILGRWNSYRRRIIFYVHEMLYLIQIVSVAGPVWYPVVSSELTWIPRGGGFNVSVSESLIVSNNAKYSLTVGNITIIMDKSLVLIRSVK